MSHRKFSFRRAGMVATLAVASLGIAHAAIRQDGSQDDAAQLVLVNAPASYLGVNIRDIDDNSAKMLGLKTAAGVEVIAVDHDAPAGKSGLHLRDVIVTVDGKAVTSSKQFRESMSAFPPDREVNLGVMREGKPLKFAIKLADRVKLQQKAFLQHFVVPMPEMGNSFSSVVALQNALGADDEGDDATGDLPDVMLARPYRIGAVLEPLGPQLAAFFGVKDGTGMLVKSVEADGPAAVAGLQAGDVILKLNDQSIVSPMDWIRAMQTAQTSAQTKDKPIQLTIVRNKHVEVLTIAAPKTQAKLEWPELPPIPDVQLDFKIPDVHIDEDKLRVEMDAMKADLRDNPALSRDEIQKALADAKAQMPDMDVLRLQLKDDLKSAGILEDGKLSPKLQQQMHDAMEKAKQQLHDFQLDCGNSLQPY
jgi:membrane-associated protease RseP (regulator of RpoE activity)